MRIRSNHFIYFFTHRIRAAYECCFFYSQHTQIGRLADCGGDTVFTEFDKKCCGLVSLTLPLIFNRHLDVCCLFQSCKYKKKRKSLHYHYISKKSSSSLHFLLYVIFLLSAHKVLPCWTLYLIVECFSKEISYFVNIYEMALTIASLQSCQKCHPRTRTVIFTSVMTSECLFAAEHLNRALNNYPDSCATFLTADQTTAVLQIHSSRLVIIIVSMSSLYLSLVADC